MVCRHYGAIAKYVAITTKTIPDAIWNIFNVSEVQFLAPDVSARRNNKKLSGLVNIKILEVNMKKFSWERIKKAFKRLDRSSRGSDEEYYNNLLNEWKSMCEHNYLSTQNLIPAKPPESD